MAASDADISASRHNQLKRFWWCCIVRDRLLSLGLRRELLITQELFKLDSLPALGVQDLIDEVDRSRVYDPDTKKALIHHSAHFFRLCKILTDLLSLMPQPEDGQVLNSDLDGASRECLFYKLKVDLATWYSEARSQMPASEGFLDDSESSWVMQSAVYLHTHTLRLYY